MLKEETGHLGCELAEKTGSEAGAGTMRAASPGPGRCPSGGTPAVVRFPRGAHSTSTQTEPDALADPFGGGGTEAGPLSGGWTVGMINLVIMSDSYESKIDLENIQKRSFMSFPRQPR